MVNVRITDATGNKPTFTQWDVDRELYITGVTSKPCLHFANAELSRALVVESVANGTGWKCKVPNFVLQYDIPLAVSVFVQPDEGQTVLMAVYPVRPRMKPQDYDYTENIGYVNWVVKSAEAQALLDALTAKLDAHGFDGFSPDVTIEEITGGHQVTITDKNHPSGQSFNVVDGKDVSDSIWQLFDRPQLFNKYETGSIRNMYIRTTDKTTEINKKSVLFCFRQDAESGQSFSFKLYNTSYAALGITRGTSFANNVYPDMTGIVIDQVSNLNNYDNSRGYITLANDEIYIGVLFVFDSETGIDEKIQTIADNLVIVPGIGYPSEYLPSIYSVKQSIEQNAITTTDNVVITGSNYTEYFTDFNDAPDNKIYSIMSTAPIANYPPGSNQRNFSTDLDNGRDSGVLITAAQNISGEYRKVQFFIAYYTHSALTVPNVAPISYRIARKAGSTVTWWPWSKFDPALVCMGSNCVVRHDTKQNFFEDLDDAPSNSIYQLDLDCVEGDLAHDPCPGVSRVLQTVSFTNASYFGRYQLLVAMAEPSRVFFRYGWLANNSPHWTSWAEMVSSVNGKTGTATLVPSDIGALSADATLDDVSDGTTYKRATALQLEQIGLNKSKLEEITEKSENLFDPEKLIYRYNAGTEFGHDYVKVISTRDAQSLEIYALYKLADITDFSANDVLHVSYTPSHIGTKTYVILALFDTTGDIPTDRDPIWGSDQIVSTAQKDIDVTITAEHIATGKTLCLQLYQGYNAEVSVGDYATFEKVFASTETSNYVPATIPVDQVARNIAGSAIRSGLRVETSETLSDVYDALPNYIYTIASENANVAHLPFENAKGTLMTYNYKIGDSMAPGSVVLFVSEQNQVYTMIKWGGSGGIWTSWKRLIDQNEVFKVGDYYSGVEMFPRFGVIGDSFSSGTIYTPGVISDRDYYYLSWGQTLARMSGNTCVNYSQGGMGTYEFTNSSASSYNTYGLGKVLSDISSETSCDLYLLCLGINDSNNTKTFGGKTGGLSYLGTSSDIDVLDYTQNANSFWGNYGKIIAAIQTASPTSRIVMCTFARIPTEATSEAHDAYIQAIQQIAAFFSIPCITLTDDLYFNSGFYLNKMVGSHPTAPQYVGYAKAIDRLFSKTVQSNYNYFKEYIYTSDRSPITARVTSVNSKTGAVTLTASDVGAGTYSKPSGGIPDSDLTSAVQTSLGKADTAYQKPSGGIPAADLASGVIPSVPGAYTSNPSALGTASPGSSTSWARGDHVHPKPSASDIGAAPAIHTGSIALSATWTGAGPYTQTVTVTGATVTSSSKVDLQPDATALAQLLADGVTALFITNNAGTLTATAIGAATTAALTIQCTVTEVSA